MKIYENTPWSDDKNLATAYNEFMELVPNDSWVLFRDADTMILDPFYGTILRLIIETYPEASCFSAVTNRIGSPILHHNEYTGDDIVEHKRICDNLLHNKGYHCSEMPYVEGKSTLSGFFFLIKKSAWEKVGGFKNYKGARSNMLGVDNMIHKDLEAHGLKTMVMNGVYVYHWYRGGDSFNTSHLI